MAMIESKDWRSEFRLHPLDMAGPAPSTDGEPHWMLQDETMREWIRDVANEYEKLIAAGGDPFDGEPVTLELIVDKLGFGGRQKPRGLLAQAWFTASLVSATTRHATGAQRAAIKVRRLQPANS